MSDPDTPVILKFSFPPGARLVMLASAAGTVLFALKVWNSPFAAATEETRNHLLSMAAFAGALVLLFGSLLFKSTELVLANDELTLSETGLFGTSNLTMGPDAVESTHIGTTVTTYSGLSYRVRVKLKGRRIPVMSGSFKDEAGAEALKARIERWRKTSGQPAA